MPLVTRALNQWSGLAERVSLSWVPDSCAAFQGTLLFKDAQFRPALYSLQDFLNDFPPTILFFSSILSIQEEDWFNKCCQQKQAFTELAVFVLIKAQAFFVLY